MPSASALIAVRRAIADLIVLASGPSRLPLAELPPPAVGSIRPAGAPEAFFTTEAQLPALLAPLSPASREKAIRDAVLWVANWWISLDGNPDTQAYLPRLQAVRSVAAQAINSFPAGLEPKDDEGNVRELQLDWHLKLDQAEVAKKPADERVGTRDAWEHVKRQLGGQPYDVAAESKTAEGAARLLGQARRLVDVLLRLLIAGQAAAQSGMPLAVVMALYRTEGDLAVPPQRDSLLGTDRPEVPGPNGNVRVPLPPGRSKFPGRNMNPAVEFGHLVWAAGKQAVEDAGYLVRQQDLANLQFHILIAGLDAMWIDGIIVKPGGMKGWLAANRTELLGEMLSYEVERLAWKEFSDRYAHLVEWESASRDDWAFTPGNTGAYTAGIVEEGARFLRRMGGWDEFVGGPASNRLPDILAYLNYHAYVAAQRNPPALLFPRGYRAVVLSALVAAGKSNRVPELRQAIAAGSDPLRQVLASSEGTGEEILARANDNWDALLAPFLANPERLVWLAKFIENATTADWNGWTTHRTNVIRYKRLLDYYRLVFPGDPPDQFSLVIRPSPPSG